MHRKTITVAVLVLALTSSASAFPVWSYIFGTEPDGTSAEGETDAIEMRQNSDQPILRYDTVLPVLKLILTPLGRMVWPQVESWLSDIFGAYLEGANRAIDAVSQYASENISFQTGDTYYSKSDMIDGHGRQSLIITLPSGRAITVLTFKTKHKFNMLDEFPQLSETLNEVRKLNN